MSFHRTVVMRGELTQLQIDAEIYGKPHVRINYVMLRGNFSTIATRYGNNQLTLDTLGANTINVSDGFYTLKTFNNRVLAGAVGGKYYEI